MMLAKLQQDPTQTPVTSRICSRPMKILNQQDYNINVEQGRNEEIYNANMFSGPCPIIEQQTQMDYTFSRQFHEEEWA